MENKSYQNLLKLAPFGYAYYRIILDKEGCPCDYELLEANVAFEALTGLNANDIIGKKISEIMPEIFNNDFDWVTFYGELALKGGQKEIEQYFQPLNKWFKIQATSTKKHYFSAFFTDVSHNYQYASVRDATDRIQSEASSSKNERRMRSLFDQTNDAVFIIDLEGNYTETNKRASQMFGYTEDEMKQLGVNDLSADPRESNSVFNRLLQGDSIPPYTRRFIKKNGDIFPAEVNVQIVFDAHGEPDYIQSVVRDITHRHKEEEMLRARDALLKKMSQQIPGAIYQYQFYPNGKFSFPYVSENIQELFELNPQEAKEDTSTVFSRLHPDDYQRVMDSILESYLSLTPWEIDYRVVLPEKGTRWLRSIANPEKQTDGSALWYGYTSDITPRKQEEQQLQHLTEQYMLAIEGSNDGIWDWNLLTNKLFLSKRWKEMLGYEEHELENEFSTFTSLIHPNDYHRVMDYAHQYLSGAIKIYNLDFRMIHKDGSVRWITAKGAAVKDMNGHPYRMAGAHTDITDRKTAEEALQKSEEKFRSLVDSLNDIVFTLDAKLRFSGVYGKWLQVMGYTTNTFLGKTNAEIFGYKAAAVHQKAAIRALRGKVVTYEWTLGSGNDISYFQTTLSPIYSKEGKVEGLSGVGRNITTSKRAVELEKQMQLTRQTLEFKQKFLASMSHEIRTPLTGVMGIIELMESTSLDNTQKDFINTLKYSAENLREIIDQVLDYSRIEAGKVKLHTSDFAIQTICTRAETLFNSICRKPVAFSCRIDPVLPPFLIGDQKRITQVINNLLINAIKFTDKGSITLHIKLNELLSPSECVAEISITDTGVGIKQEKHEHMFKPFAHVHTIDTHSYEGIGVGLAICKELVELHEGTIGLDSKPGEGSRFWFTFKAGIGKKENVAKKVTGNNLAQKPLKILFVEDKLMTQKIVRLLLTSMGHSVTLVNNGKEALDLIVPGMFDLVLMDIQMPVMDGITATRKLREKFETGLPPIVGLSANNFEGDRKNYMDEGLDEFLSKPLKKEDFLRITQLFSLNGE